MTYWRRRFIALTIGLGVLSVIAWAFSGTLGASNAGGSTGGGSTGGGGAHAPHEHAVSAAMRSGGPGGTAGRPQASASAAVQPPASAQPSASPSASPGTGTQAQAGQKAAAQLAAPAPQGAAHPARACKPGNVVLTLFAGQDSYGQGQVPQFAVDVVSTGVRTCGFNVGSKHLSVVVRSHGARVWASDSCAAGRGSLVTDLARGVPVTVPVSWNLETSALACQGAGQQAPAGRYTASASDGAVTSNPVRFTVG